MRVDVEKQKAKVRHYILSLSVKAVFVYSDFRLKDLA